MKKSGVLRLRLAAMLLLVFLCAFAFVQPVGAQGIIFGDSIPAGTVIENDLILAGNRISIDGTVVGDVLAYGVEVIINGEVDGSLIIIGQDLTINGQVKGAVYAAGMSLTLGEAVVLDRNLYFVGFSLTTQPGSTVNRDLKAISVGAQLAGTVGRNTSAIIGPVEIFRALMDLIGRSANIQRLSQSSYRMASISHGMPELLAASGFAGFHFLRSAVAEVASTSSLGMIASTSITAPALQQAAIDFERLVQWGADRLRDFAILLIFGLLALWLLPAQLKRACSRLRTQFWFATGYGLLALVISLNIYLLVALLGALLMGLGLWLGTLGLWGFTLLLWFLGFSALGVFAAALTLFLIYGTKVIVFYLLGQVLLERFIPRAASSRVLALILGLLIFVLLNAIPYLGWVVSVFATALGLGAALLYYRNKS